VSAHIDGLDARYPLAAGALLALVATAGSLYLSEGLGLVPCELCWYQRILMYPLVAVFGVALVERRPGVSRTVLPLSTLGTVLAAYHSWLQVAGGGRCAFGGCATVQLRVVGLTIPNLSLAVFALVTATAAWLAVGDW
jgi:disulfide bond formation protein DsbB